MDKLKKEYTLLFNGITDTILQLENAVLRLKLMQQQAEDVYLEHQQRETTQFGQTAENVVMLEAESFTVKE